MNGIIHQCSHPNDEDVHFRISEEKIFADIFHYLEVLFRIIKPRKVFFMAVDGVAPRAKMNQQRGRRFRYPGRVWREHVESESSGIVSEKYLFLLYLLRSAKEAEDKIKKALEKGEVLPTEARFDSNCITPGIVDIWVVVDGAHCGSGFAAKNKPSFLQGQISWPDSRSSWNILSTANFRRTSYGRESASISLATRWEWGRARLNLTVA